MQQGPDARPVDQVTKPRDVAVDLLFGGIDDMDEAPGEQGAPQRTFLFRHSGRALPQPFGELCVAVRGDCPRALAVVSPDVTVGRQAEPSCLLDHRLEHRLEVAGRRVDDLQHLRRRRLPLQRLALFGQQAGVVHGDDGLSREVLQ